MGAISDIGNYETMFRISALFLAVGGIVFLRLDNRFQDNAHKGIRV
jgi:hypothetical protein